MTIKECIDIVDSSKPNQYTIEDKVRWLSFVDETIINDVLKTHEGYDGRYDLFEGYSADRLSEELIVESPYDRLYAAYLKMMIDSENGETARYNNSASIYNTYLLEFKKYYNKTHMPINISGSGVTINVFPKPNFSNASEAEKAAISAEEARASAVKANESAEESERFALNARLHAQETKGASELIKVMITETQGVVSAVGEKAEEVKATAQRFYESETQRAVNEELRASAERSRSDAEGKRYQAEEHRAKAESDRILAEMQRAEAFEKGISKTRFINKDISTGRGDSFAVGDTINFDFGEILSDVKLGDVVIDIPTGCFFECIAKYEDGSLMGDRFKCIYVPKSGGMVFKGVVDALPETASENDVYKVSSTEWELYGSSAFDGAWCGASKNGIYLSRYGESGTFTFADDIASAAEKVGKIPAPIKVVNLTDGFEFIINYESQETTFNLPEGGPPEMSCSINGQTNLTDYITVSSSAEAEIYYGKSVSETYIRHNGEWVEL